MDNIEQVKEIESALIGSVLRDGTKYEQAAEIVKPDSFGVHAYGYAWLAMEHLKEAGIAIDVFTVGDELERMNKMDDFSSGIWSGRALLSDLRSNGEPRNILAYAENVQDHATKRQLDAFFTKCVVWSKNGRRSKEIMQDVNNELGKITLYSQQDEFTVPFSVAVSEAYDETDIASQGQAVGIKTGLIDLDNILGSLLPKNVYLIAARPGEGKTALMGTIAMHAAKEGKRVGIFSLEMSRAQVAQRLISQESGIDLFKIINGKMNESEWTKYTEAVEKVAALPITINDLSSININSIRQTSRKIKEAGGLDLVILDYIQLTDSGGKKERRELEVSEVSRGLKYLARELNVPVLAASQLNRDTEKKTGRRPILSDLRESGSLEQDAYAVMFIYTPDEIKTPNLKELIIAKHRNGKKGTVSIFFKGELTQFVNGAKV